MLSPPPRAAGGFNFCDDRSVGRRDVIFPALKAVGHGHAGGVEIVLYDDRNAPERTRSDRQRAGWRSGERTVEFGGGCECGRVDINDRVNDGTSLVVGVDAVEVGLDDGGHRGRACAVCGLKAGDGDFLDG